MNTFRILSLISLVSISTTQVVAMDGGSMITNLITQNHKNPEHATKTTSSTLKKTVVENVTSFLAKARDFTKNNGGQVIELAKNHPYYSAGIAAIVVLEGVEWVVFKNGHILTTAKALNEHRWLTASGVSAIIAAGTGAYAYKAGYWNGISITDNVVTNSFSKLYGYAPAKETVTNYLTWKTGAFAATGLIGLYAANKYFRGTEEPIAKNNNSQNVGGKKQEPIDNNNNVQKPSNGWNIIPFVGNKTQQKPVVEEKEAVVTETMFNKAMREKNLVKAQEYLDALIKQGVIKPNSSLQTRINNLKSAISQ